MKRVIKFRFWSEHSKKYWHDHKMPLSEWTDDGNDPSVADIFNDIGEYSYWEEYTGLKDKNGVDIYEGDIVNNGFTIGVVKYGNCDDMTINGQEYMLDFCGVYLDLPLTDVEDRCWYEKWEVIGNVHENPEFLKQQ